ncbi:MAG: hypothetical protein ACRDSI_12030 [Pseudonocardiaceae bacterium]
MLLLCDWNGCAAFIVVDDVLHECEDRPLRLVRFWVGAVVLFGEVEKVDRGPGDSEGVVSIDNEFLIVDGELVITEGAPWARWSSRGHVGHILGTHREDRFKNRA